jgi:hypothetical protein
MAKPTDQGISGKIREDVNRVGRRGKKKGLPLTSEWSGYETIGKDGPGGKLLYPGEIVVTPE